VFFEEYGAKGKSLAEALNEVMDEWCWGEMREDFSVYPFDPECRYNLLGRGVDCRDMSLEEFKEKYIDLEEAYRIRNP
jgi:hypothetical protein